MVPVQPLQGVPAALISRKSPVLCVADLHIGYELELRRSGFNVPDRTGKLLEEIVNIDQGDELLIVGDLKHTIPYATRLEASGLRSIVASLQERFSSVTLVAGNHDGAIRRALPETVRFVSSEGLRIGTVGIAHGHRWPSDKVMRAGTLLWAHLHPCVRFRDRMGAAVSLKCWLRGPVDPDAIGTRYPAVYVKESVIMPAFNQLITGAPVNEDRGGWLSPLDRSGFVDLSEQHAYTLDGVDLGRVSALHREGPLSPP